MPLLVNGANKSNTAEHDSAPFACFDIDVGGWLFGSLGGSRLFVDWCEDAVRLQFYWGYNIMCEGVVYEGVLCPFSSLRVALLGRKDREQRRLERR